VKADPADQSKLLGLAELDLSLARNRSTRTKLPEAQRVDELSDQLTQSRSSTRDALGAVDELQAEVSRAESDVQLVEQRLARDTQRLDQSSSVKDVQGLQHEIDTLRERLSVLEEVELEVMERLEAAQKQLTDAEAETQRLEAEVASATEAQNRALEQLDEETAQLEASRADLIAQLPAELVELYERQRERYGVGASLLRAGISSASGVKLTESDLAEVRRAADDEVVLCPDSNAILVRTAESGLS